MKKKKKKKERQSTPATEERMLRELPALRRDLNDAMAAKYGGFLEPGETLLMEVERNEKFISITVTLENDDETSRFELEAAWLPQDQHLVYDDDVPSRTSDVSSLEQLEKGDITYDDILDHVVDYIDVQLEDYFEADRYIHYNDDWRMLDYFGYILRYRSVWHRPHIEKLADAWIKANGDPTKINGIGDGEEE